MEGGEREPLVTVWNFRENYNRNSSTLHGYTRNVHRVHSSVGGLLHLIKADVYSYVHSILSPPLAAPPSLSVRGPLSSYGRASAALFAYYRRAACRQQAIEIPLASLFLPLRLPFLSLFSPPKGRKSLSLYLSHANISKDRDGECARITGRRVIVANRSREISISRRRKRNVKLKRSQEANEICET